DRRDHGKGVSVPAASLASERGRLGDASATSYVVCDQIGKVYGTRSGKFEALRNVSFAVPDRQFVSLLGPSGCGKTTVLMMVGGLEEITAGRITVDGSDIVGPRQ